MFELYFGFVIWRLQKVLWYTVSIVFWLLGQESVTVSIERLCFARFTHFISQCSIFSLLKQIDQSALGLSREYLTKGLADKIVKAYYEYMVDMAVIYGAERSRAESELMDSLNFEIALANVSDQQTQQFNYQVNFI